MENEGFSDSSVAAPAVNGVGRTGSYVSRKISHDYNANQYPRERADDAGKSGERRKVSRKESVLPEVAPDDPDAKPWKSQTNGEKVKTVIFGILKFVGFLGCLYFFICSLDLLSSGFNLLGGKATGKIFQESDLLKNPICGLMIGVMATVMVQSSSTSTSIVVAMTASGIISTEIAIPIIMGANVGTSVTNTLVSLAQVGDRDQFERAFAGATVHDMFNWLSVFILLPLEVATHYLGLFTHYLVKDYGVGNSSASKVELLSVLTSPLTDIIVQIDKKVIEETAQAGNSTGNETAPGRVLKIWCKDEAESFFAATPPPGKVKCHHLFANWPELTDLTVGAIVLCCALLVLILSLVLLVKILNGVFKGSVGTILQKFLNAEFPGIFRFLTGYAAMGVGALVTILVQSSSVFTSTLTPLVGLGAVSIERFYPLTLGSNIGTTFTAMMAAFAQSGSDAQTALQIALCHLFFNLSGILLFYPIPFMRKMPIALAKGLGSITAQYRWFCAVYVVAMFVVMPLFVFGLSMAGTIVFGIIFGLIVLLAVVVVIINLMQNKKPHLLPAVLKNWDFLPLFLHSLDPYDRVIVSCATKTCGCCACVHNLRRDPELVVNGSTEPKGLDNAALNVGYDAGQSSVSIERY